MPKEMKESIVKIIGSRFFIWFLTLAVVVVDIVWLTTMENSGVLWAKVTGGTAVLPLAEILRIVVKTKKDKTDDEAKLKRIIENHNYKIAKKELALKIIEAKIELKKA